MTPAVERLPQPARRRAQRLTRSKPLQLLAGEASGITPEQHVVLRRYNLYSRKAGFHASSYRFVIPLLSVLGKEFVTNEALRSAIQRRYTISDEGRARYTDSNMTRWWNATIASRQVLRKCGIVNISGRGPGLQYTQLTDKGVALQRELGLTPAPAIVLTKPALKGKATSNGVDVIESLRRPTASVATA